MSNIYRGEYFITYLGFQVSFLPSLFLREDLCFSSSLYLATPASSI